MPDFSPKLNLPYLLASQTQKHVVINECFNRLDNLIMPSVISRKIIAPPIAASEGDNYLIPENNSDEWGNKKNQIAIYYNLGWEYIIPNKGFICFINDENQFLVFNGSDWVIFPLNPIHFQNLPSIGIGTSADNYNLFASKTNSALFCSKNISEGGNGNIFVVLSKENESNSASYLFQNNWSGRAELGLIGNDNLLFKVSSDGTIWKNAIEIDKDTSRTKFSGIDFYAQNIGENEYIRQGTNRFFHCYKSQNTWGDNLFFGTNAGNFSASKITNEWEASSNIGIGTEALLSFTNGFENCAIGIRSLRENTSGFGNSSFGFDSSNKNIIGNFNSSFGRGALYSSQIGNDNCAFGAYSLFISQEGHGNCAFGRDSLSSNISGHNNSALGINSLRWQLDGSMSTNFNNCVGIGANTRVSGSNQVQLGDSNTTTYTFGAVQNRSDARDKVDIRDTILGLDFINNLRPVDFKWDMRDDYFNIEQNTGPNGVIEKKLVEMNKDGSKKRSRYHHGIIAQELKATLDDLGIDFGGYQDHSLKGGADVFSIGYEEFIAPIIKAIQEMSEKIANLEAQIL
jgi:Protein of unknown function (DUF2793)/Chaperone of endosialidase